MNNKYPAGAPATASSSVRQSDASARSLGWKVAESFSSLAVGSLRPMSASCSIRPAAGSYESWRVCRADPGGGGGEDLNGGPYGRTVLRRMRHWSICEQSGRTTGRLGSSGLQAMPSDGRHSWHFGAHLPLLLRPGRAGWSRPLRECSAIPDSVSSVFSSR